MWYGDKRFVHKRLEWMKTRKVVEIILFKLEVMIEKCIIKHNEVLYCCVVFRNLWASFQTSAYFSSERSLISLH